MDALKAFDQAAASYGIGIAVLLAVVMGLLFILWKIGNRLAKSHEDYLAKTAAATEKAATVLEEIKTALPTVCQAQCPHSEADNYRPRVKPKPHAS